MRDPKRIRKFLNQFADIWETYFPDMRFCQLIYCVMMTLNTIGKDPFYIEEDEFLNEFRRFAQTAKNIMEDV